MSNYSQRGKILHKCHICCKQFKQYDLELHFLSCNVEDDEDIKDEIQDELQGEIQDEIKDEIKNDLDDNVQENDQTDDSTNSEKSNEPVHNVENEIDNCVGLPETEENEIFILTSPKNVNGTHTIQQIETNEENNLKVNCQNGGNNTSTDKSDDENKMGVKFDN